MYSRHPMNSPRSQRVISATTSRGLRPGVVASEPSVHGGTIGCANVPFRKPTLLGAISSDERPWGPAGLALDHAACATVA